MPNFSNYAEQLAAHTKIFHGKDTNKPSAKANFICILPRRRNQRYYLFAKRKTGPVDFSGPVG
jgi:hypothetical protein